MENPYDPIDPMWFVVQNIIAREESKKAHEKLAKLWIRRNRKMMSIIITTPRVPNDKPICQSFSKDHGHCLICWFNSCECYPLDLWKCIDESIGKIKRGEW